MNGARLTASMESQPNAKRTRTDFFFWSLGAPRKSPSEFKVRFIIGVSQRTRTDFLSQTNHRIFIGVSFGAPGPILLSELLWLTMPGDVPLLDYVPPIFVGLVSAHTDRFFLPQTNCRKERSDFFSGQKSSHMKQFSSRFFVYDKNRSVCAGHNPHD